MKFNEGQIKAIETRGKDILVSASAGSGKTAVMIERILRFIEEGADPSKMLIVTFTKAAAAEMRERLFQKLCERSENEHCREALDKLPQSDISTLHSFCAKLARTYFYAIDVDPTFELLGDDDSTLLARCMEEVVGNLADGNRERLYGILLSHRRDGIFKRAVEKLYLTAVGMPNPSEFLDGCLDFYASDDAAKKVLDDDLNVRINNLLCKARDCLIRTQAAGFTRNEAALASVVSALESRDVSLILPSPMTKYAAEFGDLNEEYGAIRNRAKELLEEKRTIGSLVPSGAARWCAEALVGAAMELAELYSAQKKKNCVADYNDLEHFAYDILSSDCGDRIRDSYDYIFVDEYQDINPLQDAIIGKIKRENNLFMVGDLKQSIYAFRGCDPSIFAAKRELFSGGKAGYNIELNENFRTLPAVIDSVNKIFDTAMTADFGGIDYKNDARLVPNARNGGKFRYVNIVTETVKDETPFGNVYRISEHDEVPPRNKEDAESDFVVGEIIKLLNCGDSQGNGVAPSDIAVLTRSHGQLSYMIRDKLKKLGVAAYVKQSGGFNSMPFAVPLIAVLRLTDNVADDIALTTALKSYIMNFSSDKLAEVAQTRDIDEPFWHAAARHADLKEFFDKIEYYTALKQSVSAGELLGIIATDTDAFVKVRKLQGGDENARALTEFLTAAGGMSVDDFLEKISDGFGVETALPEGCLKIMTVHMSKGLEFPYVFFAGVSRRFNNSDFNSRYIIDRKWGLAFKYPNEETHDFDSTFLFEAARIEGMHRALEEELRIMYVALTRAKKELVISGTDIDSGGFAKRLRRPSCPADFLRALEPETVKPEAQSMESVLPRAVPVFAGGDAVLADNIIRRMSSAQKSDEYKKRAKTSVTAIAREDWQDDGYVRGESLLTDEADAAERGTACHLFMQFVDFDAPFEPQTEIFRKAEPRLSELVDFGKTETAAYLIRDLTAGYKLYREKEFIEDRDGTLVQGVIDLLAVKDGEALVIDYKTGSGVGNPRYATQLDIYAEAVERLLGLKVRAKYICALDLGKLIEL